jgi:hypothetical protein
LKFTSSSCSWRSLRDKPSVVRDSPRSSLDTSSRSVPVSASLTSAVPFNASLP